MKKVIKIILCVIALSGCSDGPKKISGAQFQKEIESGRMATMYYSKYLGEKNGKAYLQWQEMRIIGKGWEKEIHYAVVEEINRSFYQDLKKEMTRETKGDK